MFEDFDAGVKAEDSDVHLVSRLRRTSVLKTSVLVRFGDFNVCPIRRLQHLSDSERLRRTSVSETSKHVRLGDFNERRLRCMSVLETSTQATRFLEE